MISFKTFLNETSSPIGLSNIDLGYEWVLQNAYNQPAGRFTGPSILRNKHKQSSVRGKKFFDDNIDFIKENLLWNKKDFDNLEITDNLISYGSKISLYIHGLDLLGPPPMKLAAKSVEISGSKKLNSLADWLPEKCESLSFVKCPELTFKGAGVTVKECQIIAVHCPTGLGFHGGVLGLFKIKGLEHFMLGSAEGYDKVRETFSSIMYSAFTNGDEFDCQDKLIAAGFKEQAKL